MKLPEYVLVYGVKVPVVLADLGDEKEGETDGKTIWINTSTPKRKHKGILLHELWHCFIRRSGIIQDPNHNYALEEIEADGVQNLMEDNFIFYPKKQRK